MSLDAINKVQRTLTHEPIEGRLLAEWCGLSVEECYEALVWLYTREMARISRMAVSGRINGWISA